jgi:LCP family protein required for cell wall assembly
MIEQQLRESFARHEMEAPNVDSLRQGIVKLSGRRRRRRIALRSTGVAAIVAVVLLVVPLILRNVPDRMPHIAPGVTASPPDGPLNFLVLGLEPFDQPGSDSVTVVHLSGDHTRAYLIDFERDLLVDIPGHGQGKLTSAYKLGGTQLTKKIVQDLTGITFNGVATVTLDALRDLTNAVGGINLCLPETVKSIHTGRTFPTGCYPLDGAGVADLVRQRMNLTKGGYARDANIQRVMMALVKGVHSLNLLTDATRVAALLHVSGLQVDLGDIDAIALAAQLKNLDGKDLTGIVAPNFRTLDIAGVAYEQLDSVVTPQLFKALRDDTLDQFAAAHPDWLVNH